MECRVLKWWTVFVKTKGGIVSHVGSCVGYQADGWLPSTCRSETRSGRSSNECAQFFRTCIVGSGDVPFLMLVWNVLKESRAQHICFSGYLTRGRSLSNGAWNSQHCFHVGVVSEIEGVVGVHEYGEEAGMQARPRLQTGSPSCWCGFDSRWSFLGWCEGALNLVLGRGVSDSLAAAGAGRPWW